MHDENAAALHRLSWDASILKDIVKMKFENGRVTLTGNVDWHFQHDEVDFPLLTLSGVTGRANQIIMISRPKTSKVQNDIEHAMHRSWYSPDHIKVPAKGGEIYLTGKAQFWHDFNQAFRRIGKHRAPHRS